MGLGTLQDHGGMVPYDPGGIGVQRAYGGFIPSLIGLTGTMQASAFSEWALFHYYLSLPFRLQRFCFATLFPCGRIRPQCDSSISLGEAARRWKAGGGREA
jgi:hypothetical protein